MSHRAVGQPQHSSYLATAGRALRCIRAAWRQRRQEAEAAAELMTFSDRALADVGIGRCEIRSRVRSPENG
ncbi:hypothetical protein BH10PSE11_BH10PSE11_17550 [soil metagenome]